MKSLLFPIAFAITLAMPLPVITPGAFAEEYPTSCSVCVTVRDSKGKVISVNCKPVMCTAVFVSRVPSGAMVGGACLIRTPGQRDKTGTVSAKKTCDTSRQPKGPLYK